MLIWREVINEQHRSGLVSWGCLRPAHPVLQGVRSPGRVSRSFTGDGWLRERLLVSRAEQRGRGINMRH